MPARPDRLRLARRIAWGTTATAVAAIAVVAVASPADTDPPPPKQQAATAVGLPVPSFAPLAERLAPTVVSISVIQRVRLDDQGLMPFRFFFGSPFGGEGPPPEFENRGSGSGVVLDAEGLVVTNAHVVKDANEITVQLRTGEALPAEVVGLDEDTDLAVLRISPSRPLTPAEFGDSDALRVGDWVVAIGNPFGLENTVTAGIVSAKERHAPTRTHRYANFIQTDASINPGNSGGPLFDLSGRLVGINTAINAAGQGIGFAIPSNMARQVVDQLRRAGRVERSWLGVTIQTVTAELAQSFGLEGLPRGALIGDVVPDSPAARAGIRRGDIVLRFDERELGDAAELPWLASVAGVDRTVRLQVFRDGTKRDVRVTLSAMPENPGAARARPAPAAPAERPAGLGIQVGVVAPQIRSRLDLAEGGAMVERVIPGSAAADHGLRPGDVILEIDGRAVDGPEDVTSSLAARAKADVVRLLVRSVQGTRYLGIRLR
jgi:serine protease Do